MATTTPSYLQEHLKLVVYLRAPPWSAFLMKLVQLLALSIANT